MKTKVLLVDDHKIILDGLRLILAQQEDIEVIGETDNGEQAIKLCREKSPHIVVMDIGIKGINGIEATRQIREMDNNVKIIALSVMAEMVYVKSMFRAGASGYVQKESSGAELVEAIRDVMKGKKYLSKDISSALADDLARNFQEPEKSKPSRLSSRELEVLKLIARGFNSKTIALELGIAEKTVGAHRRKVMEKLQLFSVADLTRYAMREGFITPEE